MSAELEKKEYGFIEIFKKYLHHGHGVMLCYVSPKRTLEYVMWRQENGFKKFVLNEKLLQLYNSIK